jgi:hypothetical protein
MFYDLLLGIWKNYGIMATVYKVEAVSHWINYTEEQLRNMLEDAIKEKERQKGNEIQIKVERQ